MTKTPSPATRVALGLVPGCTVRVQQRRPAYVIWVGETLLSLAREVAADIHVQTK